MWLACVTLRCIRGIGACMHGHKHACTHMIVSEPHPMLQLTMTDLTPVRCVEDAWNYVARLGAFPTRLGHVARELTVQAQLGIFPPKFVLAKVLDKVCKLRDEAKQTPETCALYSNFLERLVDRPEGSGLAVFTQVPDELKAACVNLM